MIDRYEDMAHKLSRQHPAPSPLHPLADYFALRAKGLRKPALAVARAFVDDLNAQDPATQRRMALEMLRLGLGADGWPGPIRQALLTLVQRWAEQEPANPEAHRWLGVLTRDVCHFEALLALQPGDMQALAALAQSHLDDVDYQTHHLFESRMIGSEVQAWQALAQAQHYIDQMAPCAPPQRLLEELHALQTLLKAWDTYRQQPRTQGFAAWSVQQGYAFGFNPAYYYDYGDPAPPKPHANGR